MQRKILRFHKDDADDWVAELSCGHNQHMRHNPPFVLRPWVVNARTRNAKLGTLIDCPLCDDDELRDVDKET